MIDLFKFYKSLKGKTLNEIYLIDTMQIKKIGLIYHLLIVPFK